jgi:hypothetical protein
MSSWEHGGDTVEDEWISIADAAEKLDVHTNTVRYRISTGKYRARTLSTPQGDQYMVDVASIAADLSGRSAQSRFDVEGPAAGSSATADAAPPGTEEVMTAVLTALRPIFEELRTTSEALGRMKAERDAAYGELLDLYSSLEQEDSSGALLPDANRASPTDQPEYQTQSGMTGRPMRLKPETIGLDDGAVADGASHELDSQTDTTGLAALDDPGRDPDSGPLEILASSISKDAAPGNKRFSSRACPHCGQQSLLRIPLPRRLRMLRGVGVDMAHYKCTSCKEQLLARHS